MWSTRETSRTLDIMRVAITGSSGLIGTALQVHLTNLGHTAIPVVRSKPDAGEIGWSPNDDTADAAALASQLEGVDAVEVPNGRNMGNDVGGDVGEDIGPATFGHGLPDVVDVGACVFTLSAINN